MKKTINLFIDMDGTVAQFYHDKKCLEKMYEKGYFEKLPAYAIAKEIDAFAKQDSCIEIYILSACVNSEYCEEEKRKWLEKNMPNISPKNFIFTKVGESKLAKVINTLDLKFMERVNILLDDYTANLVDWQKSTDCIGIKYINGFNNKSLKWIGEKVKTFGGLMKIMQRIAVYGN